jgi:hypothetical protein
MGSGYESATAIGLRQAAEASSDRRCYDDFAATGVADGRDPAANPSWGVPAEACWATAARKKPQTLVEYSHAMTPEEVAAMTPREPEGGVVGLKAPAVTRCERSKQTGTSPKGHVDPDHEVGAGSS